MDPRRDGDAPPDGLRRRRGRDFDEVDARIAIPVAPAGRQLLQSGINKYRSLSGRPPALVVPGAALNAPPPEPRSSSSQRPPRGEPPEPSALEHAQRLVAQKQFAAAIPYFSEALGSGSGNASLQHQSRLRVFYERGACYLAAQRYPQAIEDLSRVIALTPRNPQVFAKRARAYAQLQQHAAALSDYNEAIELAGTAVPAGLGSHAGSSAGSGSSSASLRALFLARARVFAAMKDSRSALGDLTAAEAVGGSRDAELYYERAHVHLARSEPTLALRDLDRFLELQDDEDVVDMSGVRAADEARERAQDVRFERAKLLLALASAEDATRRTDAELADVEQGGASGGGSSNRPEPTGTEPTGTGYRSAEAVALVLRAVEDYTVLLELEPASLNVAEILLRRGEALGRVGRVDDALRDLARAQELSPSDFEISLARAKLFQQQRELSRAIAEVTAVLQLNGFFLDALFLRAALYVETGELDKAQRDYTSIVDAHYDGRSESYSDAGAAAAAAVATEKTPLLSKASGNSSSAKPTGSKSPATTTTTATTPPTTTTTTPKPTRYLSPFSKKALLLRARLWVQMNRFDDAIADYEQLQLSSANEIDAQVELQDARLKQAAFVEQERRAAEASLLQGEDQERLEAEAKRAAGAPSKKKKKKKAKKKRRPTPSESGYVLLPDEEDDEPTGATGRDDDDGDAIEVVVVDSEPKALTVGGEQVSGGAVVTMTREEAFESMWEDDNADAEAVERELAAVARRVAPTATGARGSGAAREAVDVEDDDSGGAVSDERVGESGDEAVLTSSEGPVAGGATVREVIVDEKYLRKRQRQLENLRADLRQACAARDRAAIDEVLERAERKQMTDALGDEIRRARVVLEKLATGVASDYNGDGDNGGDTVAVGADQDAGATAAGAAKSNAMQQPPQPPPVQETLGKPAPVKTRSTSEVSTPAADPTPTVEADAQVAPVATAKTLVSKRSLRNAQALASPTDAADLSAVPTTTATTTATTPSTGKPPSLVIRPIAYTHALQLAEQSQHQFLQTQRLLHEKDAEIASLRQLVAQFRRQAAIERFDEPDASAELAGRLATLRTQFPHKPLRELESRVEVLVNWMGPSEDADHARHKILAFVYRVLDAANVALGSPLLVFPTGSFPMKTYLPTADLDVCLLLPKELEQTWYFPVMHALAAAAVSATGLNGFPSNTVRNVNFINADVRVIKCTVDNISVDFTANRTGALGALLLLDAMDARVGKGHLLKKSLILIKAWCIHESSAYLATAAAAPGPTPPPAGGHSVMGSSYGAFSTYAVNTAVMGLFNQFGARLTHPLQALFLFLDRMAEFPWHDAAMTLHGPVALSALASAASLSSVLKKKRGGGGGGGRKGSDATAELHHAKMSWDDVELLRLRTHEQFGAFDAAAAAPSSSGGGGFKTGMFPIRVCNIVDPLDEKNNLARSVSVDWFPAMKRAFRLGRNRLAELLTAEKGGGGGGGGSSAKRVDELDDFFVNSWRTYGRGDGWRPDLLVHPRQVWHGKAATGATAAGPSDPNDEELRWQSILPELVPLAAGPYQPQPQGAMFYPPQYPLPYPQQQQQPLYHRRSFDNSGSKSSPLKTPGPYALSSGVAPKAARRYESPPAASHGPAR
ncbi:hypothetical protein PybrP1_004752 [[Pythium] brassicae (nom. inval.)]|nr:hypothetical protein PybrP1_004752 [[Pythium] brassicae (nom. inval.)]